MKIHDWRLLRTSTNSEIYRHDNEDIQVVVKLLQIVTIWDNNFFTKDHFHHLRTVRSVDYLKYYHVVDFLITKRDPRFIWTHHKYNS